MVVPVVAQATGATVSTGLVQLIVQGLALGAVYALIALGFVIIFKATDVINFSHGALMLLGAYVTWSFTQGEIPNPWGPALRFEPWPFYSAVAASMAVVALVGVLVERSVLRKMVGQPVFSVVLITLGLEIIIRTSVQVIWNPQPKAFISPWGINDVVTVGGLRVQTSAVATLVVTAGLLLLFFLFFRFSRFGLAMRATAFDQEAALAMGIQATTVFAIAWAIAGALAAVGGALFIPRAGNVLEIPVAFAALRAFPAAILGGLDSPGGAVVGGLIIGVAEVLSARYISLPLSGLGFSNFHLVFAYLVMIAILFVRPYGLWGTPEVRRV